MSIKCPTCKVENKDGAKFCKECGCSFASLISCPACSALIKSGRFCASCGHSFATPAPKAAEIPASETSTPKSEEQTTTTPIDISLADVAEPAQPLAPAKGDPSAVMQPAQTPTAQEPKATPTRTDDNSGVKTSLPSAEQPPHKTHFKIAYALVPLAVVVVLGGAYWWKSNHAETATAPVPAANPAPVATTPVNPVTPAPAPTAPVPTPDSTPVRAPEPVPVLVAKTAPVIPTQKQEPAKVSATTVKPVAAEKSPLAEKPAAPRPQIPPPGATPTIGSAHPAPKAQAPNTAAPAKSLDETYNERITAECPQGFFPGMACREKVRWQMCEGKWSSDAISGQTTCKGGGTK